MLKPNTKVDEYTIIQKLSEKITLHIETGQIAFVEIAYWPLESQITVVINDDTTTFDIEDAGDYRDAVKRAVDFTNSQLAY